LHHICVDILLVSVQVNPRARAMRHDYGMAQLNAAAR
jgi:hypothetical protein